MSREEIIVASTVNSNRLPHIFCLMPHQLTSAGVEMHRHSKLFVERTESDPQTLVVITGYSEMSVDCALWFVLRKIPLCLK